ncbi:hypothetical protein E7V67_021145 [[Empedobacter] haloabium]|uniref:Uncharacterized protein n=1 Tax=[Empedobacter] haloabium TaxID=592317 RepID=A0ABZ1UHY6_9BURK
MINFSEGKLSLGAQELFFTSDCGRLTSFCAQGLIEKRQDPGGGEPYFYGVTIVAGMKFGLVITPKEDKIASLALHWLDGPCTGQGWDGVSDELLWSEYRLLLKFVQKNGGGQPDRKQERQHTWYFKWGQVVVSYQQRDFVTGIFIQCR